MEFYQLYYYKGFVAESRGLNRNTWETDVAHNVKDSDDPDVFYSRAWWKKHHFDGPHIDRWLKGWDASAARNIRNADEPKREYRNGPSTDLDTMTVYPGRTGKYEDAPQHPGPDWNPKPNQGRYKNMPRYTGEG